MASVAPLQGPEPPFDLFTSQEELVQRLVGDTDLPTILNAIVLQLHALSRPASCAIFLAQPELNRLTLAAESGVPKPLLALVAPGLPIGENCGTCGHAVATGQPTAAVDALKDPKLTECAAILDACGIRATFSQPILDEYGNVIGSFGLYRTQIGLPSETERRYHEGAARLAAFAITRVRRQMESKRVRDQLEAEVHARTAQLEAANEHLESIVRILSHDLRAGVRSVSANTRFIREQLPDDLLPSVAGRLQRLQTISDELARLLESVLSFASVRTSDLRGSVSLPDVFHQAVQSVESLPEQLTVKISGGATVSGNAQVVQLILKNLVENASRYAARENHLNLQVSIRARKGIVRLEVKDDGPGIPPDKLEQVFEPRVRLQPETCMGHGIGLSNARMLAQALGGNLMAAASDQGARFILTLPAAGSRP